MRTKLHNTAPRRDVALDAARGIAVMAMVIWHTSDAYMCSEARDGTVFTLTRIVGGYAAPLFFLLAGVSLGRTRRPLLEVLRGAWVFLAGVALALFQVAVDRAGVLSATELPALAFAATAIAAAMRLTRRRTLERAPVIGFVVALLGLALCVPRAPGTVAALSRLDVLHGIGLALMVSAACVHALGSLSVSARALTLVVLAVALASVCTPLTELARAYLPGAIAGLFVRSGRAQFALVPWLAYALAGVALGLASSARRADGEQTTMRAPRVIAGAALVLALACADAAPTSAALDQLGGWTGTPRRLLGNAAMLVFVYAAWEHAPRVPRWLALLGANSLSAYCIHLELSYGLLGLPVARALGPLAWLVGAATVTCITWAITHARAALTHNAAPHVEQKATKLFPFTLERAEND